MKFEILIKPQADEEIIDAARWYEHQRVGLAQEFLDALEATLDSISPNPKKYRATYRQSRHALVPKFPYAVYFLIEGDRVVVYGIGNTARDPNWMKDILER
jgi:plasmid stabilization system protein ParE